MLALTLVVAAFPAAELTHAQVEGRRPVLNLSSHRGTPGTRVKVVALHCRHPTGEPDQLAWHDSYHWALDLAHHSATPSYRRIPVTRVSPTKVVATFVVSPSDRLGRGVLVMFCAGSGNATGLFTVTRP
jgi:hypothetical protein